MDFLAELGLFVTKGLVLLIIIVLIIRAIAKAAQGSAQAPDGHLRIRRLDKRWNANARALKRALLPKKAFKQVEDEIATRDKSEARRGVPARTFVIDFDGNTRATQVSALAEEINAIVLAASPGDEVVIRLKSPGGVVHGYGLAAAQLTRLRDHGLRVIAVVDEVAASGGYMMAAVADTIIAAPFAIVGSIGVVAGVPNLHRWLQGREIDYELVTAGKYKRTLTVLGENTEEGRAKFQAELEEVHALFKAHIGHFRPQLDLERVATGEHWYGLQALELGLIDQLGTSDAYLLKARERGAVFLVSWITKKKLLGRAGAALEGALTRTADHLWDRAESNRFPRG